MRQMGQVGQVKDPLMRFAVSAHGTAPVNTKYHMQILQGHIM